MRTLGVDPGAKGALALLQGGKLLQVHDMPTMQVALANGKLRTRIDPVALGELVRVLAPHAIFIEQVGAMPGEGPTGAFSFGRAFGAVEGAAGALGVRATLVPPQTWQRAVGVRRGPDGTKTASRRHATRLWPEYAPAFERKKDDGRSDAALIGLYGYQVLTTL